MGPLARPAFSPAAAGWPARLASSSLSNGDAKQGGLVKLLDGGSSLSSLMLRSEFAVAMHDWKKHEATMWYSLL